MVYIANPDVDIVEDAVVSSATGFPLRCNKASKDQVRRRIANRPHNRGVFKLKIGINLAKIFNKLKYLTETEKFYYNSKYPN